MPTCNWLDLQTLGSRPVMPRSLNQTPAEMVLFSSAFCLLFPLLRSRYVLVPSRLLSIPLLILHPIPVRGHFLIVRSRLLLGPLPSKRLFLSCDLF